MKRAMKFLVLQHTPWEGPGVLFQSIATQKQIDLQVIRLWRESIPETDFDGLIVLGGSPNVNDEDKFPYLKEEKRFISSVIAADKPYLGFCLGHQLLAVALGANVGENYCKSIGFIEGHLTQDGKTHPVFKNLTSPIQLFKWHGQAVLPPVPKNMLILATSVECQVEAISVPGRPHILGVQNDNHAAHIRDVEKYWQKDQKWLSSFSGKYINPAKMLADAKRLAASIEDEFERFFSNFLAIARSRWN